MDLMIEFLMQNVRVISNALIGAEVLISIVIVVFIIKTEPPRAMIKRYPRNVIFRLYIPFLPGWRRHIKQEDLDTLLKSRRWTFLLYLSWFLFGTLWYLYQTLLIYGLRSIACGHS